LWDVRPLSRNRLRRVLHRSAAALRQSCLLTDCGPDGLNRRNPSNAKESPVNTPAETPFPPAPRLRNVVTDLLTGGGTTLLVGLCLLVPACILPPLMFPAAICLACGAGVALAGILLFPLSRRPASG